MNIFVTSDTHFLHKNIGFHCPNTRWGLTGSELDEKMIEIWNNTVKKKDLIYHMGDFSFGNNSKTLEVINRLNGTIKLVRGNHDVNWIKKSLNNIPFEVYSYFVLKDNKKKIVMFHYPILEWEDCHHGSYHLYGHVHGNLKLNGRAMDVGVDATGNLLTEFSVVIDQLENKEPSSHHGVIGSSDKI